MALLLSDTRPWIVPVLLAPPPCAALVHGKINPITSAVARVFNTDFISIPPGNFRGGHNKAIRLRAVGGGGGPTINLES